MLQVSRDSNLKIPKKLEDFNGAENSIEDKVAVKQAIATAENKRFNKKEIEESVENDNELEQVNKLPFNANDLMVIIVVKKLATYIIAVTEKSPKKFRGVFVNRMQNYCLDTLECLLEANFIRMDAVEKKTKRGNSKIKITRICFYGGRKFWMHIKETVQTNFYSIIRSN